MSGTLARIPAGLGRDHGASRCSGRRLSGQGELSGLAQLPLVGVPPPLGHRPAHLRESHLLLLQALGRDGEGTALRFSFPHQPAVDHVEPTVDDKDSLDVCGAMGKPTEGLPHRLGEGLGGESDPLPHLTSRLGQDETDVVVQRRQ